MTTPHTIVDAAGPTEPWSGPAQTGTMTRAGDPARTTREATGPVRTTRSWPLLVLAAPAAVEVWSGWVGIAQKTGFGMVSPLPGIWPALHVDTTITLPIGVEAYAAYALRAWLSHHPGTSDRTRRFAKQSAICSFLLGMAGQIAYHLLNQSDTTRAPWIITTIVSCLPVLVLAMGTTLAHMLQADTAHYAAKADTPTGPGEPADVSVRSPVRDTQRPDTTHHDRPGAQQDRPRPPRPAAAPGERSGILDPGPTPGGRAVPSPAPQVRSADHAPPQLDHVRSLVENIIAAGQPVTRRTLREYGAKGSNERLNHMANRINSELASGTPHPNPAAPARPT